jgi:hypothetical protein
MVLFHAARAGRLHMHVQSPCTGEEEVFRGPAVPLAPAVQGIATALLEAVCCFVE